MVSQSATPPQPTLPSLESGIQLLETEERSVGPLQSLVLDRLLTHDGHARWVDSHGYATTQSLARLAPSRRVLDRVQVARGFTAFQHHELVRALTDSITEDTTLVVVPAIDALYRGDALAGGDSERLFSGMLGTLDELATNADVPVLVSRRQVDCLSESVETVAVQQVECQRTRFGPRFVGEDFETLVYRDGDHLQTTLAFWVRVLERRQEMLAATPSEGPVHGAY